MKKKKKEQTDLELSARIQTEINSAIGYLGGDVSEDRRIALDYYQGEAFGNEVEGRSQVVSRDVADVVDAVLPQLARIFMASENYVQFIPRKPDDDDKAKQATEFCNYVLENDNNKFNLFYTWFKDALIQKNGVVKVYWDVEDYEIDEEYEMLTPDELMFLIEDPDIEIKGIQALVPDGNGDFIEMEHNEKEPVNPGALYNVQISKKVEEGYPKVENIPPEDFLVSRRTRVLNDAPFSAHRRKTTQSELIIEGYDKDLVEEIPTGDEQEYNTEKVSRYNKDDEFPYDDADRTGAEREIWVYECYMRYDYDGDGKSELRRIVTAGTGSYKVLENTKADFIPFCSVTPFPLPHKFYGESQADKTMDIQLIKSTLWRQMLDNLYLINNGRTAVNDNVNLEDLLVSRPGGVVRMDNPGRGQDWDNMAPEDVTRGAYPMLEYCDVVRKNRTGIDENITGLDPDTLQEAKTGAVNRSFEAAQMKIELIARVFAETGVKDLFKKMLKMLTKYQTKERMIRLRDEWVPMNPREWDDCMNVKINVGLGTGNKDQQLNHLMKILELQVQGMQMGLSGPELIYNTLEKLVTNAGFSSEKEFFKQPDPNAQQQGQDQGNPLAEAEMIKGQYEIQKTQMKLEKEAEMDQMKQYYENQLNQVKESNRYMIEQMKQDNENHRAALKAEIDAMVEGYKVDVGKEGLGDKQSAGTS